MNMIAISEVQYITTKYCFEKYTNSINSSNVGSSSIKAESFNIFSHIRVINYFNDGITYGSFFSGDKF